MGKCNVIDSKSKKAPPPVSRKRLWLFRVAAALLIPVLLLVTTEVILRAAGAGYPTQTAVRFELNGQAFYGHNLQFGWRFFPPRIARDFNGFAFEARKKTGTYRIFILGESAAMGMPEPAYNFGRILEVMLRDTFPEQRFEVVNAAMVAINSHTIREIAKDCSRYEPDLFVVYMGNNEVVGPFGPGSAFSPMVSSLPLIRANIAIKSTRIGQLFSAAAQRVMPQAGRAQRWAGLEMFLEHPVRSDDPSMAAVYEHFERNLRDICAICKSSGADVLVSTVGVNVKDCPPFGSLHRRSLTDSEKQNWDSLYSAGVELEEAGRFSEAIEKYNAAAVIDGTFADLQFRTGHCHDRAGDIENARLCYERAMECDVLRLRTNHDINRIIRSVADTPTEHVRLVDGAAALESESPNGICGQEMFYEHVHLTFKGNYVLAREIAAALVKSGTCGTAEDKSLLSEQECAARLVYTGFEQWEGLNQLYTKMLSEPPFTNQLYHAENMDHLGGQMDGLKQAMQQQLAETTACYEKALAEHPDDWLLHWRYAIFLLKGKKDPALQEQHLRKVLPWRYVPAYLQLAQALRLQGRASEAENILNRMLKLKPNAAQAHVELANLSRLRRDNDGYIEHMSKSIAMAPAVSIEPYGALGAAYEQAGKPGQAIKTLQRAVAIFPPEKTAQAHATLGYLFCAQKQFDKADKELQLALKLNPAFADDALFQSLLKKTKTGRNTD